MSQPDRDTARWVLGAADALIRHRSWTGRIHIQKHLFLTQLLQLARPPFDFVLYDYGPYSFELDEQIGCLEMFGLLERSYPQPGYGPRYTPTPPGLVLAAQLPGPDRAALNRVGETLGDRNSQDLELIATCLWFEKREGLSDRKVVVARVKEAKPKYDEAAILPRLEQAEALAAQLAAR
jgi:uncharacterized protein YwgA